MCRCRDVVLHLLADDAAARVEHRQTGADLVREGEQVQVGADPPVVAALGLGQPVQVRVQRLGRLPGGAVDPLQLRVRLVAAPVGGRAAGQLEGRDVPGGRHVRAAAQVAPDPFAGVRVQVVVDGQLAGADLDALLGVGFGAGVGLEVDQLELVRLGGELGLGVVDRVDHPAGEPLAGLDDLAHPLVEVGEVLRGERPRDVEVVVEAVLDRRADAELGVRERLLHGLRQHVGGGVPDHRPAVLGVGRDRLGLGVLVGGPGQVAQPAVAGPGRRRWPAGRWSAVRPRGRLPRRSSPPGSSRSEWARRRGRWTRGLLVVSLVGHGSKSGRALSQRPATGR